MTLGFSLGLVWTAWSQETAQAPNQDPSNPQEAAGAPAKPSASPAAADPPAFASPPSGVLAWRIRTVGEVDPAVRQDLERSLARQLPEASGQAFAAIPAGVRLKNCEPTDLPCVREESVKINAAESVTSQLARVGDKWLLTLYRIEAATEKLLGTATRQAASTEELQAALSEALDELYGKVPPTAPPVVIVQAEPPAPPESPVEAEAAPEEEEAPQELVPIAEQAEQIVEEEKKTDQGKVPWIDERNIRPDLMLNRPTAFPAPVGKLTLDFFYLGLLDLSYQFDEHWRVGSLVLVPAYMFGVAPHLTYSHQFHEYVSLSMVATGGFFLPMWGDATFWGFGGGPTLSVGRPWAFFHVNLMAFGGGISDDFGDYGIIVPTIGGLLQVHRHVLLMADLTPVVTTDQSETPKVWIIQYGLRIQDKAGFAYGDIGFWVPASKEWYGIDDEDDGFDTPSLAEFFPLGVPFFKFGFVF
ncbi:MAG: hypothetical protein C4523_06435 [Myxococcales bacterium]|nr:MAG: hypothetical protein C4523_06435 [Myxococcales bacterium]